MTPARALAGRARRYGAHTLRQLDGRRRPLPEFLIIGAQKAGTSSLHDHLCQHPMVTPPVTKEVHYFDHSFDRGDSWYRAHFAPRQGEELAGESTPYYLFHPAVPARAASLVPAAKLIVLLRDPVARAYSQHNHERTLGFETLDFEPALAAEAERLRGAGERLLAEPGYSSFSHQHHSYLARGLYAEQLERWFELYPRDQVLVIGAEELFADPVGVVLRCQRFLGLEEVAPVDVSAKNAREYVPIPAATEARLRAGFAGPNERLFELLGRRFEWD
jgi:hypothetical protein